MSGYLEVKYPFKPSLGLNPFKSWKRQWCILRPSATCAGASLAVYCSEAGAAAGSVELPLGCVVRRAQSRSRTFAFAVYSIEEPSKARVLLAAQNLHDAQLWMEKIRALLDGSKLLDTEPSLKDSYSVSVIPTDLSRKCGLHADTVVTLTKSGVLIGRSQKLGAFVPWKDISDVQLANESVHKNRTCVLVVDSEFLHGSGEIRFSSPQSRELAGALRRALCGGGAGGAGTRGAANKLSRSEGDLRADKCSDLDIVTGPVRRSSWYSGPSEVSVDDIDLVMSKDMQHVPPGGLSRCAGAGQLAPAGAPPPADGPAPPTLLHNISSFNDSMSDRRSLLSIASGIYEEIPDLPAAGNQDALYCKMTRDVPDGILKVVEPTYESVAECVYGTMRRAARRRPPPPPPLPPRTPQGTLKPGQSWATCTHGRDAHVTRHSSLGSLPRCCGAPQHDAYDNKTKTLPKLDKRQPFSVFRKRLKSDSRIVTPKSETSKDKDVETKKKKFDFTPTRDIFKNFKVSRKMKNLKIANTGNLSKGETKSCEFLDETEHVQTNRCSKSVECLENDFDFEADLSIELSEEAVAALSLPQEIVQLILGRDQNKVRLKDEVENEYMPMSPIIPPPMEHHYIVMSPRTHIA